MQRRPTRTCAAAVACDLVAEPVEIQDGDIVQVHRVELYYARVERAGPRDVVIQPLDPRIADRASACRRSSGCSVRSNRRVRHRHDCDLRPGSCASTTSRSRRRSGAHRHLGRPPRPRGRVHAVIAAAADVHALWCLVGTGPDPAKVVGMVGSYFTVALAGNNDYGAHRATRRRRLSASRDDAAALKRRLRSCPGLRGRWLRPPGTVQGCGRTRASTAPRHLAPRGGDFDTAARRRWHPRAVVVGTWSVWCVRTSSDPCSDEIFQARRGLRRGADEKPARIRAAPHRDEHSPRIYRVE
jgi:hypothetical protein